MPTVKPLPQKTVVVNCPGSTNVIVVSDIRAIAQGRESIAECADPEAFARALATLAIERIDMINCDKIKP